MMRKGRIENYITGKSRRVHVTKGDQPDYTRNPTTHATSKRLLAFRRCIADKLRGKKYGSSKAIKEAFAKAAKECEAELEKK